MPPSVWLCRLLLALILVTGSAALPRAQEAFEGIAGNPGAVNVQAGSGEAGRLLGLPPDSGIRLGGVLVSNANYLASGGNNSGMASFNNLLDVGLDVDLDRLFHIPGASFGADMLRFDGQPSNQQAGLVTGYNGLTGPPPLDRTELYQLWWRQSFFADKLAVRFGKLVPTYDFGNVVRPVPVQQEAALQIPAVSGLIYTPLFVNPTILGALPGYYNSAYGVTITIAPTRRFYTSIGIYDGNGARGTQTGLQTTPVFNGYRFQIGEAGIAWLLGSRHLPGTFSVGVWDQTGRLLALEPKAIITQDETHGAYLFGSQRLWRGRKGDTGRGVSGFMQLGINDSRTMLATRYVGAGMTAFRLIPGRPLDSFGAGLALSWLNRRLGFRKTEALLQFYDQLHVIGDVYLQPAVTLSPEPGEKTATGPAVAFTIQSTILF